MKPPDQAKREAIQNEKDRNVTVQASAGTGKTTLMVDRVLTLIQGGIVIDKLVVVTFTNAAAAELRTRIREKLKASGCPEADEALKNISAAWIGTIHSFASRLLKEMFHYTGADPSFRVSDGHFTPEEIERKWDIWLHSLTTAEFNRYRDALVQVKDKTLREIVIGLESRRWAQERDCLGHVDDMCEKPLIAFEAEARGLLDLCTDTSDAQYINVEKLQKDLLGANAGSSPKTAKTMLDYTNYKLTTGSKKHWDNETLKEKVKPFLKHARDEIRDMAEIIEAEDLTTQVWELTSGFARKLREEWDADKSRLSFNDLLYMAWQAIKNNSKLQQHLKKKFSHVMIDEFQDTSKGQVNFFTEFLVNAGIIPPGRITIVADDKQSIYGWRNADIVTYKTFCDDLKANNALSETIETNFRSTKSIIEFINIFGERLFSSQTEEEKPFGCKYSKIIPPVNAAQGEKVTVRVIPAIPEELENKYSKGEYGAKLQAIEAREYIQEKISKGESPENFALLVKSTTHLHHFVNEFEQADIPYFVEATREFRSRPEIIDLREMINCLLNPTYSLSWVHVLRSYFFGISDRVIDKAIKEGTVGFLFERADCPEAVKAANKCLRRLQKSIRSIPLSDFIFELYLQSNLIPIIVASGYQEVRRLGNLQYILEEILSGEVSTAQELLCYLDEELGPTKTEEPSTLPENGGAVTITTIHRAKGLGWKHVIFAAPSRGGGNRSSLISYEHAGELAFNLGITLDFRNEKYKMRTPYWHRIKKTEKARKLAEDRRLIYVAVTRAKESLLLFTKPPPKGKNPKPNASNIFRDCIDYVELEKPELMDMCRLDPIEEFVSDTKKRTTVPLNNDFKKHCSTEFYSIAPELTDRQNEGAKIGDMVHSVMEKISFDDPKGWFSDNEIYIKQSCSGHFEDVKEFSLNFFEMKLPFTLEEAEIVGREYPYIVQTDTGVKQRYIDLLLKIDDRLLVIDYKTDSFENRTGKEVAEGYFEKQQHYLDDVSEFLKLPATGYLVFLREKTVFSVPSDKN